MSQNHNEAIQNLIPVNTVLPVNETVVKATMTEATSFQAAAADMPIGLTGLDRWVAHRAKVPVDCHTGMTGDVTSPATWVSYTEAQSYTAAHPDTGLGFVLSGDGIVGVDIDHCLVDGKVVAPKIQAILDRVTSYCEISPSGTGLHIFVNGQWPEGARNKIKLDGGIAVEVYDHNRYFTVTGNRFGDAIEVTKDQALLDFIYDEFFSNVATGCDDRIEPLKLNIVEVPAGIMCRINHQINISPVFSGLWSGEDRSDDESSDDMKLLCRLVPLCGYEPDFIAAAFMASPFAASKDEAHRGKLERPDYLGRSIAKAMEYMANNKACNSQTPYFELLDGEYNDFGNAQRLLTLFKGKVLYNPGIGNWLLYEDGRWCPDNKRKEGMLKRANELYRYLEDALSCAYADIQECDEDMTDAEEDQEDFVVAQNERKREYTCLKKSVCRLGDSARQKAMIRSAEAESSTATIEFNRNNHLLVVQNGTVDLRSGNLLPHIPEHYITMRSDIRYNASAPEPKRFLQFLDEIFDHNADLICYIRRLLGYCLTGETREHVFHVLHGEGANGKSVLINLFQRMFSEYCRAVSSGALAHRADGDKPNPSLLQAKDCRTIIVNETNSGLKLNGALIKQISAGDEICPRTLFQENQNFVPHMKILWITNHIPEIDWEDGGLRRRYRLIPFLVTFGADQQDRSLPEKLWAEREGILSWLVHGAVEWYAQGLGDVPEVMETALERERRNEDNVYAFFKDKIIITNDDNDRVQASDMYDAYLAYCANNEIDYPVKISTFGTKLPLLGITKKKMTSYNVYIGVKLCETED